MKHVDLQNIRFIHIASIFLMAAILPAKAQSLPNSSANVYAALFNLGLRPTAEIIDVGLPYDQLDISPNTLANFSTELANLFPKSIRYQKLAESEHLLKLANQHNVFDEQLNEILDFKADASLRYDIVSNTYAEATIRVTLSNSFGQSAIISDFIITKDPQDEYARLYSHYLSIFVSNLDLIELQFDDSIKDIDKTQCRTHYLNITPRKAYARPKAINEVLLHSNVNSDDQSRTTSRIIFSTREQEEQPNTNYYPVWISIVEEGSATPPKLKTYLSNFCFSSSTSSNKQNRLIDSDVNFNIELPEPIQRYNVPFKLIANNSEKCMPSLVIFQADTLYFIIFPYAAYNSSNLNVPPILSRSLVGTIDTMGKPNNFNYGSGRILRHSPPQNIGTLFFKCFLQPSPIKIVKHINSSRDTGFQSWKKIDYSTIN